MSSSEFARIAVVCASNDPHSSWYGEILRQAGLLCEVTDESVLNALDEYDVLILCGRGKISAQNKDDLRRWLIDKRRQLVITGSMWELEYMFDLMMTGHRYSREYFGRPADSTNIVFAGDCYDCLFIGGEQARALPGDILAVDSDGMPLAAVGSQVSFFGPNLGITAELIMMGRGVSNDLIGPGDGSCFTEDGVQRAEDGTNLLWTDRARLEKGGDPAFLRPHLDQLREQFLRLILRVIDQSGTMAALIWPLPGNMESACTVSIECDSSSLDHIKSVAGSVAKFGVRPAWMIPPPGLPQDMYRAFKKWGHDVGHLYKPERSSASIEEVRVQNTTLARGVGHDLALIKGYDGTWFGLTRLYDFAEATGAVGSLCKGGRQPGTSGFLFGTSRPFMPRWGKRTYRVIEVPSAAFTPGWVTSFPVTLDLIESTRRHNGVFQFALLTSHAEEEKFESYLFQVFAYLKDAGIKTLTPSVIAEYELARRQIRVKYLGGSIEIRSDLPIKGFTLLVGGSGELMSRKGVLPRTRSEYCDREWSTFVFDVEARIPDRLGLVGVAA